MRQLVSRNKQIELKFQSRQACGRTREPRTGFTKVDLLFVIFFIALIGLLVLPGLNFLRVNARKTTCENNLRFTALAVLSFMAEDDLIPAMATAPREALGNPAECDVTAPSWSWQVFILPYMEASATFELLDPYRQTADELIRRAVVSDNEKIRKAFQKPLFVCPADQGPRFNESRRFGPFVPQKPEIPRPFMVALGNYVGVNTVGKATRFFNADPLIYPEVQTPNAGVFEAINEPVSAEAVRDGFSTTFMIGERAWRYRADDRIYESAAANQFVNRNTWVLIEGEVGKAPCGSFGIGNSDTCASSNFGNGINFPHVDPLQAKCTYSSLHGGGANFALCDGSFRFVKQTMDPITMMEMTGKSDADIPLNPK